MPSRAPRRNSDHSRESRWSGLLERCSKRSCSPRHSRQALACLFLFVNASQNENKKIPRGKLHSSGNKKVFKKEIRENVRWNSFALVFQSRMFLSSLAYSFHLLFQLFPVIHFEVNLLR